MNAATRVFTIPELLELILLSLPSDTFHQKISSIRFILLSQTTCRLWHTLLKTSTPIRQCLYNPNSLDSSRSQTWHSKHAFPPAEPNPFIPDLLLNQRSWGSHWPFDNIYTNLDLQPSQPKFWTFAFEISRAQYFRIPAASETSPLPWREMLIASPPFTEFWYTRCFYELGSGRAPFVTHLDYDAKLPKSEQRYRKHCSTGITLGHVCDAIGELFEKHITAKFVLIESVRVAKDEQSPLELSEDRPTTRSYIPGSSAERAHGWHRTL